MLFQKLCLRLCGMQRTCKGEVASAPGGRGGISQRKCSLSKDTWGHAQGPAARLLPWTALRCLHFPGVTCVSPVPPAPWTAAPPQQSFRTPLPSSPLPSEQLPSPDGIFSMFLKALFAFNSHCLPPFQLEVPEPKRKSKRQVDFPKEQRWP